MKLISIFIFTFFAITTYGQEIKKDSTGADLKKVLIGVNFSPDVCYRTLKNIDGSATDFIKYWNGHDIIKFGYTTGFDICLNISKNIGLEMGIQYSNKGFQTKKMELSFWTPEPNAPTKIAHRYNYHYLDIPLKANFTLGKKKVRFFSSAGLCVNFLVKKTITSISEYSDGRTNRSTYPSGSDNNILNLSPILSAGIDYKINNQMNLRIEPTFRYEILKVYDGPIISENLWNAGLNIGYYFGF